ncbi:MAG: hypothetical protein ACM3X1_10465 [Ignavibacteriales bacterium]
MTLISPTNERANRLIGIYSNLDKELYDAFRFLEPALENNEIILLLVDDSLDRHDTLKARITDFENNIKEGNLLLVKLSTHYVGALAGDLEPFNAMERELTDRAKIRKDKHVRIVADCAGFLYENKHFDECVELEQWWHQKPFEGSYLCPFRNSLCDMLSQI